jgi:hypothetical protein
MILFLTMLVATAQAQGFTPAVGACSADHYQADQGHDCGLLNTEPVAIANELELVEHRIRGGQRNSDKSTVLERRMRRSHTELYSHVHGLPRGTNYAREDVNRVWSLSGSELSDRRAKLLELKANLGAWANRCPIEWRPLSGTANADYKVLRPTQRPACQPFSDRDEEARLSPTGGPQEVGPPAVGETGRVDMGD